ncbi:MAG: PHP domain-containing protein [Pseudodesulfovibrio sp.]|nr:PHP domain-containing protein [Pseudodesulfovibrio sp.]
MLIDLHVHSTHSSCSELLSMDILSEARSKGLDGVCITDHDSTQVLSQISEGFQSDGLLVLVGMEYTTSQGDFLVFGHVEALLMGLDAPELLASVRQMGGAAIAAHPYRGWRPTDISIFDQCLCSLVEVENGRNSRREDELASALAFKRSLTAVSGSDAHSLVELGRCPTRFTVPVTNRIDLVRALNQGCCEPAFCSLQVA